jgi:hypothetical protein
MSRITCARTLSLILATGMALSSCSSAPPAAKIPSPKVYGTPGYRFAASFLRAPAESTVTGGFKVLPQYHTGFREIWNWTGGEVRVFVGALTQTPPPKQVRRFLRSFLPTTHGGRIVTRFGSLAATETVPCSTPSGSCPGTVGTLVMLDGTTIYEISEYGLSSSDAIRILHSFRIVP